MTGKWYNKETRNSGGDYYRRGDWGVEQGGRWGNPKGNYTQVVPPVESIENDVPCDWDEKKQVWVVDESAPAYLRVQELRDNPLVGLEIQDVDQWLDSHATGVTPAVRDLFGQIVRYLITK